MVLRLAGIAALSISLLLGQSEDGYSIKQRISRIRELGKQDSTALPALRPSLSDSNRDVRLEAVKAMVKIGSERSLDGLVEATRDKDPEIKIRATDGIVNYYVPGYVVTGGFGSTFTRGAKQIKEFFASRNNQVVDPDIAIRPDVAKALAEGIGDGYSLNARTNAALAAGILRDREAVPALSEGVHSKDSDMIFECLVALQKIKDPASGPAINFLARDLDDRIQATALETIGILHSADGAVDVRYALSDGRSGRIRRAALEALAMLALPADRAVFQQYSTDKDVELRASALEGLGRLREPEDAPALQAAYDESDAGWQIHLAAAFALANAGKADMADFSPLPYLLESVNSKNRADAAAAYLTELAKHDDVRANLLAHLPTATKDQKLALCPVLAASQNDDVIPALTVLSKDIDANVALAASRAIRILQARKAQ